METVTYVEMTAPDELIPAAPVEGLTLDRVDRGEPLIPGILARIGAPHGWRSSMRTAPGWAAWFAAHPDRMFWLLSFDGEPAGMLTYDLHPETGRPDSEKPDSEKEAEIVTFGLVPEFVGKGLGGYALTLGVRRAWALAPEVSRVWLHTSSFDHPHALPNYHRRGFRTFKTEQVERDLRRLPISFARARGH